MLVCCVVALIQDQRKLFHHVWLSVKIINYNDECGNHECVYNTLFTGGGGRGGGIESSSLVVAKSA